MPPEFLLRIPLDAPGFLFTDRFNVPRTYANGKHEGLDLVGTELNGTILQRPYAVLAGQRGVVDNIGFSPSGYGNYVRIKHQWGTEVWVTWYGHLDSVSVAENEFVTIGTKLGIAGNTGNSTGIHLHLTVQRIGRGLSGYVVDDVVNPEPLIRTSALPLFDEASYVADMTIPDDMQVQPGQTLTKTWRVRNTGNTTWGTGYALTFASDNRMGGPTSVPLPAASVAPGQVIDISVPLTMPLVPGTARSTWKFKNAQNVAFDYPMFALVQVVAPVDFDEATFVSDVTIDPGTILQPGQKFVKTWRIRNTGTRIWTRDYKLAFAGDNQMGGPANIPLPRNVAPNDVIDLSVELTAPAAAGRQKSTWKLRNAQGVLFDNAVIVDIQIAQVPVTNEMRYVADVTIDDGAIMTPGQRFRKTWRVRNSGTTTWGTGHVLAFFADNRMGGPQTVPLPALRPGQIGVVSVDLVAPTAPGEYKSTWKPRDPQGRSFQFDVFALIEVQAPNPNPEPLNELSWVSDVTIPDGTIMRPGQAFTKTWRIRNTGTSTWGASYKLAFANKDQKMNGPDQVSLPTLSPGQTADVTLQLTAPTALGMQRSSWEPRDAAGTKFEHTIFALIKVEDPALRFDMLEYMRGDGRLYDIRYEWAGGGTQRVQTQVDGKYFFHVKNSEWEELWADDDFIYRGTDTSPGNGRIYTLFENGKYGSAWVPRNMSVGVPFKRTPLVIFRRKSNGQELQRGTHVTWIKLLAVHSLLRLPSGIQLPNVAELAAYEDVGGQPKSVPFERYMYAKRFGLVAWSGEGWGRAYLSHQYAPGTAPNNVRENIPWLQRG